MSFDKNSIVITSAVRTAIGTFRGSLKEMQAKDLGALVTKAAMKKSNLNPPEVDELIMGQVLTGATGQNPARQAAIQSGLPNEKTAYVSIIIGLLGGFLMFPAPDFSKSLLFGILLPKELFAPIVSQSLLFLSFVIATFLPLIVFKTKKF